MEIWRKLKEQRAEAAGAHGGKRAEKALDERLAVAQTSEVRDALRSLEAESKSGGNRGLPVFELRAGGKGAESVVDLDGRELRAVVVEERTRGSFGRIKRGFPGGIGPPGGADE